ncbi:hypothetical protein Tco_0455974 [Tanacetum coccineum]
MLKVSPRKGVIRFGKRGKLNPRYIGPFKILKRVGLMAYTLELPEELSSVYNTFHISNLKKFLSDESLIIPMKELRLDDKLNFVEEPMEIIDHSHLDITSDHRPGSAGNTSITPDSVHASGRVHSRFSSHCGRYSSRNQINLRLCNEESYESLRNSGLQHIHLGIFMIRLHALHRRSAGINALVVLRDTRWEDSRQIIATIEVDLSAGTQLVYTFPDMILSVNDFHNHVEVAIQTHGYDTWQGGESNLLITMALTGRLSNTSYMGFQYSVENVVDHLTTTGITAIPGERRSIEELEGMSWHLKPPEQTSVRVPSRVAVNERLNRSVSLRFERYRQTPQPPRYSVDQHDREVIGNDNLDEDEEHFIGICLQAPQEEHISYDVCFCESCLNEAMILEEEPLNKVRRSNKPKDQDKGQVRNGQHLGNHQENRIIMSGMMHHLGFWV